MAEFFLKLLDWPFLLFLGIGILIYIFQTEFKKLLVRGGVNLTWGDKSFAISDLPDQLNETFAPVTDDIENLRARLEELENKINKTEKNNDEEADPDLSPEQVEAARKRMLEGLESGKFKWRSIDRLATIGNVSQGQASAILRPMSEVVFSRGKSGSTIVKFVDK